MINIDTLAAQIKANCNISDARHWGSYSLCGLLLRLRELYRSEMGIQLWEQIHPEDVGRWITDREALWKTLENKDFGKISFNGNVYDPFEVEAINAELERDRLIYGAGFGIHMKPVFFLADLVAKDRADGLTVYKAGREYARDLSDHPAMLQDMSIFARGEPIRHLIWGKFEEMRCRGSHGALAYAFLKYGITPAEEPSEDTDRKISRVARSELETYIHHELGEASEGKRIGGDWKNLLFLIQNTKTEIFARAVKDILADTSENGMMHYIIRKKKEGSLGFYIVFLGGARKIIFPEILPAFRQFAETGDWELIESARRAGYSNAYEYVDKLLCAYRTRKDDVSLQQAIEREIFGGLL
ncbi:MAG: Sfum_1244 family protein [Nitrospirota bacterium]